MRQYHNSHLSFIDMLFNALTVFAALFILSVMIINDPQQKQTKKVDEKAKIMLVMTWDDKSADDMDLWVKCPNGDKVGYNNKAGAYANLDRDDLGLSNDTYTEDGIKKFIYLNKEVLTIREKVTGHYSVNVMFYSRNFNPDTNSTSQGPQSVVVQVIEIDPVYREVVTKTVVLDKPAAEGTAVSFDIVDGNIVNVNTETSEPFIYQQVSIVPGAR